MNSCCVIGLGYIGLPTALLASKAGLRVFGVDINKEIIESINNGKCHIQEPGLNEIFTEVVKSGLLTAHLKPVEADIYIIAVPTPIFKKQNNIPLPNTDIVFQAIDSILKVIKEESLIIIESTSPTGTSQKIVQYIKSKTDFQLNKINIAYCPERVIPGNTIYEMINNNRVIGGINEESRNRSKKFYEYFCKGEIITTDANTAEMVKLAENAFRDVNIAFANELSMICSDLKIDTEELINIANNHPRVNILSPGCGVGGHCIAIDPWFIAAQSPNKSKLIQTARKVNNEKTKWVISKIKEQIDELSIKLSKPPIIGCLGLSFKPNIEDLRESPALLITTELIKHGYKILSCEPNIKSHPKINLSNLDEVIEKSDILIFLVAHNCFKDLNLSEKKIIDVCGITKKKF